jgi:hypothetical protein
MFSEVLECVLAQNRMRFGSKWNAFWVKMECVLGQNGKRLCTIRVALSPRLLQNACARHPQKQHFFRNHFGISALFAIFAGK